MNGTPPDELIELRGHQLPAGCDYLWEWYVRLNDTRPSAFDLGQITEVELRSFFANRRIQPTAWELDVLIRMDKAAQNAGKSTPSPPEAGQEE